MSKFNMSTSTNINLVRQQLESRFESLPSFSPQTNFVPLMKEIINGIKTIHSVNSFISSITLLRRINKYEKKLFILLFETSFVDLKKAFKNENNFITISLLTLTYEMCTHSNNIGLLHDYLSFIIKKVIKIIAKYNQINDEIFNLSKAIMQIILIQFIPHNVFEILLDLMKNKNKNVMLKSAEYIFELLNIIDKKALKDDIHWGNMFTLLSELIVNNNEEIAKKFYFGAKAFFSQTEWEEDILCQAAIQELSALVFIDKIDIKKLAKKTY